METEKNDRFISKKELLEKYKISYGALYRWKRIGLIPEDWFIKKSASTGQETYFIREKIIERIETILNSRDSMSLEDIAREINDQKVKNPCKLKIKTKYNDFVFEFDDLTSVIIEKGGIEKEIINNIMEEFS